ncbi:MAG: hypothetical protein GF331_17905 [Chitinivibrionales bacterium]|nr:hypothetical protein [Chitinivibrionales bacterium]
MAGRMLLTALLLGLHTTPALALKGAVLHSGTGGIYLTNLETGDEQHLRTGTSVHAMFSPDGRRIAFLDGSELIAMKNDGTGEEVLTNGVSAAYNEITWTESGFFWLDGFVLKRFDLDTRTTTDLITLPGDKSQGLWMSRDGHRGVAWVTDANYDDPRLEFNQDFTDVTITKWHHISHGQIISSDGNYVIFNDFDDVFNNPNYLGHKSLVIQSFESTTPPDGLFGFVDIPEMDNVMPNHKPLATCINNGDFVLCNTKQPETFVVNWRTQEYWEVNRPRPDIMFLQMIPSCMWYGDLPSPDATTPELALSVSSLAFDGDGAQDVTVTNVGVGTLSSVSVDVSPGDAAWLVVTPGGSGNAQMLTNAVTADGLSGGVHEATVTVSGGGASNVVSYTVTLTIGTVLAAPDSLQAQVIEDTLLDVSLTWVDNIADETGFVVQRISAQDTQDVASLAANVTTYLDEDVAPGTYTYRVAAVDGAGISGAPADIRVVVDGASAVFVTSPVAGQTVNAGETVAITWSTRHVTTVEIKYSIDEGENWTTITPDGGIGTGQAEWGNLPWTVPDVSTGLAMIRVQDYGTPEVAGVSGVFSIVGGSGVADSPVFPESPTNGLSVHANAGQLRVRYAGRTAEGLTLEVFALDGSRRATHRSKGLSGQYVWQSDGCGVYLLRARSARGSRNMTVRAVR